MESPQKTIEQPPAQQPQILGTRKHPPLESAKPSGEPMLRAANGQHRPDKWEERMFQRIRSNKGRPDHVPKGKNKSK